jgi:hypothetical protein
MGFLFPSGLKLLGKQNMSNFIPWMWGINGASSVLGSVIAITVAITYGFNQALLIAAGCYCIAFILYSRWRRKEANSYKKVV